MKPSTRPARQATSAAAALAAIVLASCAAGTGGAGREQASSGPDLAGKAFAPRGPSLATAAATATPAPTRAVVVTKAAADRGERYFLLNGCFACHGPTGEGYIGPRLAGTGLPYESVLNQVRSPQTSRMPRFAPAALADDAVADIYAFLRSLGP